MMKVVHVESGLGNQMLDYAEYLAVRKSNPNVECYIENIVYEIPEAGKKINQWNGYELEKIFRNVDAKNIKEIFSEHQWKQIIEDVTKSNFWEEHWNYPPYIIEAFKRQDLDLVNRCRSLDNYRLEDEDYELNFREKIRLQITYFFRTRIGNKVKRVLKYLTRNNAYRKRQEQSSKLFEANDNNEYLGHNLIFMYKNSGIEKISQELEVAFEFPKFEEDKNKEISEYIKKVNSVAIHARRGDMMSTNFEYYQFGYFQRAIKLIRRKVDKPEFFFFCDVGSVQWCKDNLNIFSLDLNKDKIHFVDWNKGENSYRDIQLMALCKHNIITTSSFGWWATFLNKNPNKITISPKWEINTTHTV